MTEQNQNPEVAEDTEGHLRHRVAGADEVEGLDSMDDDTEGRGGKRVMPQDIREDDDAEGHGYFHGG